MYTRDARKPNSRKNQRCIFLRATVVRNRKWLAPYLAHRKKWRRISISPMSAEVAVDDMHRLACLLSNQPNSRFLRAISHHNFKLTCNRIFWERYMCVLLASANQKVPYRVTRAAKIARRSRVLGCDQSSVTLAAKQRSSEKLGYAS